MKAAGKVCKVCGKEYPYCMTARRTPGVFHWQDVACCYEHGAIYLAKVNESRGEREEVNVTEVKEFDTTGAEPGAEYYLPDEDEEDED